MAPDGTGRCRVIEDAGWPTFAADGKALYFHRKAGERWGIWRVGLDGSDAERITPADLDVFTPSASADGKHLAGAVLRGDRRQIEILDLNSRSLTAVTDESTDHWNPTIAPDGRTVAYHRAAPDAEAPNVEPWGAPPGTGLRLLRVAGSFPAFAPDGKQIALVGGGFGHLDVMGVDGSNRRTLFEGKSRGVFSVSWAHRGDRIAFSVGGTFEGAKAQVEVMSIALDGSDRRNLTDDPANDAFPAFSPDGRQLVFRSGRGGAKNLYIMDADGTNPRRLTEGDWTDTMCDWSPTGEWITFASDRGGDFEVWLIRPDGSGLRKLVGGGGRNNHPHFAPDGRWIVFTSKRAGFSAEEISLPDQPQPYGDLFAVRIDGSGLVRLTHNGFEEGTPAWGPAVEVRPSAEGQGGKAGDY
jgi:Tol biopolymer transport system component